VGAPDQKVKVIQQGVDLKRFHLATKKQTESIRILLVSHLHPQRGIVECLDAFRQLYRIHPEVELWIAGNGPLRAYIQQLSVRYPIRLLGQVPYEHLPELYRQADIFCLPGKDVRLLGLKVFEDGQYTISVLEAMASGLPVVVSNSGAYHELVEPHNTFVPQGSMSSLFDALVDLVENEETRRKIGQSNRNWMMEKFDAAIQCNLYAKALLELG
jgi:glycosyltransferase involved in cell wall biosynthesis